MAVNHLVGLELTFRSVKVLLNVVQGVANVYLTRVVTHDQLIRIPMVVVARLNVVIRVVDVAYVLYPASWKI